MEGRLLSTALPVSICIPARDEEAVIGGVLEGLAALDLTGVSAMAFFYLDQCLDGTERRVREAGRDFPFPLRVHRGAGARDASAGRARRSAMALGMDHAADGLILTTDADSRPAPDWVQAAVQALSMADVAAGRVRRAGAARDAMQSRVERYYDDLHAYRRTLDPVPWEDGDGHHFGGGANLAFRASAYRAIGGFRPIPSAEDATALDDAARAGLRVRRDGAMLVETSSRRTGRAPGGLATALRGIDAGDMPHVPHPDGAAWQYRRHALARRTFAILDSPQARHRLGHAIGLSADHVLGVGRDCPNGEAFAMRIVPAAPGHEALVPLTEASDALAALRRIPCEAAA